MQYPQQDHVPTPSFKDFNMRDAVIAVKSGRVDCDAAATTLLSKLSLQERLWLLDGDEPFWSGLHSMTTKGFCHTPCIMGEVTRLGIPGVRYSDGPRGCIMGKSTDFPVAMARAASWDIALEERIGNAIGLECKALGANLFGGICVNLPRHPAWGRIQETYGEDPILLGTMGAAAARGVQKHVMGCVKHFALNSMENSRFKVDVQVDDDVLHEVYLPQFRLIVEQGISSVMSAYNSVRGEFAGQSKELLTDILRTSWGFKGFVVEDFIFGFRDVALSLKSGLDLEAPFRQQRAQHLEECLRNGMVGQEDVDRAGHAILKSLIENGATRGDSNPSEEVVFCKEHRVLARESAARSMVLLKNTTIGLTPLLPLAPDIGSIAIVGWGANSKNTGDKGSSHVRCPEIIAPDQGLREALPNARITVETSSDSSAVKKAAASADVVVVVVGYDFRDEGEYTAPAFNATPGLRHTIPNDDGSEEAKSVISRLVSPKPKDEDRQKDNYGFGTGGDRKSLRLRPVDVEVIRAAVEANPRTVVSVVAGGAVIMNEWDDLAPAIIFGWYSGCEGGRALADLLMGHSNFSGRLPFSIPSSEDHLPAFYNDADSIKYDRWYGQHLLDRLQVKAAYPFGFGLSYTTFTLSDLAIEQDEKDRESLLVRVRISNTGTRGGRFVAQVYGAVEVPDWPKRCLLGYGVVELDRDETTETEIRASTRPLQRWKAGVWSMVDKAINIEVGAYSGDVTCLRSTFGLDD